MVGGIRILHVDDDPEFVDLTATYLEREAQFTVETATSVADGLDQVGPETDCLVSDYELSESNGFEFLEAVRDEYQEVPFILYTGKGSEAVASEAIAAGVTDYLQKGSGPEQYELLANRIHNAVQARRETERAERQEELMRLTEFAGGTGGFEVTLETGEVLLTDGACRLLGYEGETALSLDEMIALFHPDDQPTLRETLEQVSETDDEVDATWRLQTADGDERFVSLSVTSADTSGTTIRGAINDITDERNRQQELSAERRFIQQSVDALEDIFYVLDRDGTLRRWNEQLPAVTGYDEDELAGMEAVEFFPADERETVTAAVEATLKSGESTTEADIRTADGERIPYEFSGACLTDGEGNTTGMVGVGRDVTERRRRERRFQALVEQSNDIVSVVDRDGTFQYQSPSIERILGYEPAETVGTSAWEYIHPADRDSAIRTFERWLSNSDEPASIECRVRHADGSWHWMETRGNDQCDNPAVGGYVLNSRDITARKERERELESLMSQYEALAENFPDGAVYLIDESQTFVRARGEELEAVGLSSADVEGAKPHDLFPPEIADDQCRYIEKALDGEPQTFEQEYQGEQYRVQMAPVGDGDGEDTLAISVSQNITEYARRKEQLEQREEQLSRLHEATRELFGADSPEEVTAIASCTADDILDLPLNGIHLYDADAAGLVPVTVSDGIDELLTDVPVLDAGIAWEVFQSGEPQIHDDVQAARDVYNPETPVRSEMVLPLGDHGVFICSATEIGEFDDISVELAKTLAANTEAALEQISREQELQLRESELIRKNERLEEFTSIVSHDLRNPLNVAETSLAVVEDDSRHVERAATAIERGQMLIDNLLTLAREGNEVAEFTPVTLTTAAEESWQTVDTGAATFDADTSQIIQADRSRLQQLLENLLRNAVEHASTGTDSENLTVHVGDLEDGFYVADDGPGIPDERTADVFDAGYTTSDDGTGFGLRIVEQIVRAHGWEVRVTDSESGGARFEITGVDIVD